MPILGEQQCCFPDDLLTNVASGPEETPEDTSARRWWAIYSKARQEKVLARGLLRRQVPFYLPLIPKNHLYRGRRVQSQIPLFQGYLFLFGSPEERAEAFTTNVISRILPVPNQVELTYDLRQLYELIAAGEPLSLEQRLAPGRRVRIRSGPLMGLEGTITHRRGGDRLLIAVHYLQQGVSIEINDFMVDPI